MTKAPEPKDKLDTATAVNGPEDEPCGWHDIDWRAVEGNVRRLRQRIFTASQAGDLKRVRSLQKLLLRSRANALLSVRRVTERNAGRLTAGVDGEVALTPEAKLALTRKVQRSSAPFKAMPVRRVHIPKQGSRKRRPLGIPVIADRAQQARVLNALEPEWEARFEPRSYGFRPGRGCHDAIEAIFALVKVKDPRRRWVLDADLAAAFDRIAHDHILAMLGTFPARGMVKRWLQGGVVEDGRLTRTEEGTPQGGVISPLLLNIALHGMEGAAGVSYDTRGWVAADSPVLIRYADDLVCLCRSRQQAAEVKARLAAWLAPRGLSLNEEKTRIVTLEEGFDFLGFNVRHYRGKSLIKPSKAAVRRVRERLRTELRCLRGSNAEAVIKRLNPIIRGWTAYYRTVVSSATFAALDDHLWLLIFKWAAFSHSNRPRRWVVARYFGRFNRARRDRWVFGDRASGAHMHRFAWTAIVRHQMVRGAASPDDPALEGWAHRRRKAPLPIDRTSLRLLPAQDGCCAVCGDTLAAGDHQPQTPHEWERWLATTRRAMIKVAMRAGTSGEAELRLIHAACRHRHRAGRGKGPVLQDAFEPKGLA